MIDDDIRKIINKRPIAITDFLRVAKNLTNDEWRNLTKHIIELNKGVH